VSFVDDDRSEPCRVPGTLARSDIRPVMTAAESSCLLGRSRRLHYLLSLCEEGRSKTRGSNARVPSHRCGWY
jgi:hypothetical protein